MFDSVQRGWLAGDDYRVAAEAAGVVELPDVASAVAPAPRPPCPRYQQILDQIDRELMRGRWEDDNPPGTPA